MTLSRSPLKVMGNLNDPLVAGRQSCAKETPDNSSESGEYDPSPKFPRKDLQTLRNIVMEKLTPHNKDDESTLETNDSGRPVDKTSVVYAPKKRFLKDYQTGESVSAVIDIKGGSLRGKVSLSSNISQGASTISSCIGALVENELMKYENSEQQSPERCVLPLLFTSSSHELNYDEKYKSSHKEKSFVANGTKVPSSPVVLKPDNEITNCSPDIPHQRRYDKASPYDTEKNVVMKARDLAPYEVLSGGSKQISPRSLRASPYDTSQCLPQMVAISQNGPSSEEWKANFSSEKGGYSHHSFPPVAKQMYAHLLLKPHEMKAQNSAIPHVSFKAPQQEIIYKRMDVRVSPKLHSRHQSPRETPTENVGSGFVSPYNKDDVYNYNKTIDQLYHHHHHQQQFLNERYTIPHHSSQLSPQARSITEETPIDLRVRKSDKHSLSHSNNFSQPDVPESKKAKFYGPSYGHPSKSGPYYQYLAAENDRGHSQVPSSLSSSSSYNPAFLRPGDAETLKTYLSEHYGRNFPSRHSELSSDAAKAKLSRSDMFSYRDGCCPPKITDEGPSKPYSTWDRATPRANEQIKSHSRRHHVESFELEAAYRVHESGKDPKSSSPRLIPQLLPISPVNQVRNSQPPPPALEVQSFQCKLCNSIHSNYRSLRMHFVKDHSQEPHPDHYSLSSTIEAKSSSSCISDPRGFLIHKPRQEADGFHSVPKQVAEVYPIISKVSPAFPSQVGLPALDQADLKIKSQDKLKNDNKYIPGKEGFEELKQSFPMSCRHQFALDSEMNCTTCMEGFQDVMDWKAHISSMHMVRSCACRTCNKWFANAEELNKHLEGFHLEQRQVDVEYRCLYCRKAFTNEEVLYVHTREHERVLSLTRIKSKFSSREGTEIQKAIPDTTCPESDQKVASDDVASTVSPTMDAILSQEKLQKLDEDNRFIDNSKSLTGDCDSERTPSSKKSFFLKKFQQEEQNLSADLKQDKVIPTTSPDQLKYNGRMTPISEPKVVTARNLIDNLVTEGLSGNSSLSGYSKLYQYPLQGRIHSDYSGPGQSGRDSQENQPSEYLLCGGPSDVSQKQPLLKDMLLQINPKAHFSINVETTNTTNPQPRTKCVRDICDEIITHSFRESSPVGPIERLKIFDSIAFDVPSKADVLPLAKTSRTATTSPTKTSTNSSTSLESKDIIGIQDLDGSSADSTERPGTSASNAETRKLSSTPEVVRQSVSTPVESDGTSSGPCSDVDASDRAVQSKEGKSSPLRVILGKRQHANEQGFSDSTTSSRSSAEESCLENSEPASKRKDNSC